MLSDTLICRLAAALLLLAVAVTASAQEVRLQTVDLDQVGELRIIEGTITGDEIVNYKLTGEGSQILSVDLMTSNPANYFNILPAGSNEAIFIGSTLGTVADVPLPESGVYVIRVYLMRSAARRNETAIYSLAVGIGPPDFADGLAGGPDYWQVAGVGGGDALNVRSGPSTRYPVISVVRNGRVVQNSGCRMSGDERWCQIRVTGSGQRGWVAGRLLIEAAPSQAATTPPGGPVGNGVPFDATGSLPCATAAGQPAMPCFFGVVREGPGNAGVWVALGDGTERQILFEGGAPVVTNSADALSFEKTGDLFVVRVGDERFEIPEAVVNGG